MKKNLLIITCFFILLSVKSRAQSNFEILFHAGATALAGADTVYMYAGVGISNPSDHWQYGVGELVTPGSGIGRMQYEGNDTWGICFEPYAYFSQGPAGTLTVGTPIYNLDMLFHNPDFSIVIQKTPLNYDIYFQLLPSYSTTWAGTVDGGYMVCNLGVDDLQGKNGMIANFPNPLVENTKFVYTLKSAGNIELKVYNTIGQAVKTIVSEFQTPNTYNYTWRGDNDNGRKVYNGVYYYTLAVNGKIVQTNKLVISR